MVARNHSITPANKGHKEVIQSILQSSSHCEDLKNTTASGGKAKVKE
jgi:hypothetical protein